MLILCVSSLGRDSAVALFNDSSILAAIEENKLSRSPGADGMPRNAIERCLELSNAGLSDLSLVALADPRTALGRGLAQFVKPRKVRYFDHHLCHAASSFYTSDFDRSLILTLDEGGDAGSGMVALGEGENIRPLARLKFPNSLGWFYSRVTGLLGLRPHRDEHKLQWLSKDGQPDYAPLFRKLFSRDSRGLPALDRKYFARAADSHGILSPKIYRDLGLKRGAPPAAPDLRAAIARSAQTVLEEMVLEMAERYRKETGAEHLCIAGGVFLNVLLVRALETQSGFRSVYVQPVSGNAGTSLGAAFLGREHQVGSVVRKPLTHLFLGPEFTSTQIKPVLDNCKIIYKYMSGEEPLLAETTQLLHRDRIVAWCQGRTEFGHRALGNRSILASPFSEYVVENVNQFIKHREDFHPFALSLPAETAADWFDCTPNCRFMASLGTLKKDLPALARFAFHGRQVRVHTVEKESNPRFWRLLHKFGEAAPAPVLVNTSFNLFGEPLVSDPREAIRSCYCSGMDALALGPFLVVK
jgi:carbamoyltransferase